MIHQAAVEARARVGVERQRAAVTTPGITLGD